MLMSKNVGLAVKDGLSNINDNHVVYRFINNLFRDMESFLDSKQLTFLYDILQEVIDDYSISSDDRLHEEVDYHELNNMLLDKFIEDKRLQGLSERTLNQYRFSITHVLDYLNKGVDTITSEDIKDFFEFKIETNNTGKITLDNYRRFLNSFYNYCVSNGLLYTNPLLKIDRIKKARKVKQAFSDTEIIFLRENITNLRDKAIFELLLSSGMRLNELCELNRNDLNLNDCSVIVHGKGDKERECFFNKLAEVSIRRYLDSRRDNNPALFVTQNNPHNRLGHHGVSTMLRLLGNKAGVNKVHAHRFRRTFATKLLRKGVQIEQIQQLLGHVEIETTKMYIVSDEDEIRYNHKRYVN